MKVFSFKCYYALLVGALSLVGCTRQVADMYDSEYLQNQAKEAFPVKNIDASHTWSMMSTRSANINVGGVSGASYTLKVYTENPILDATAALMAKTTATGGATAAFTFDAPTALQRVFVSREGSDGRYVICAELNANSFAGSFDATATVRTMSRAASIDADMSATITEKVKIPSAEKLSLLFPQTIPGEAVTITAGVDLNDKRTKLRLTGNGTTYDFNYSSNDNITRELYVEENAKVTIKGNLNTPVIIYLLPGATLTFGFIDYPYSTPLTISVGENATWNLSKANTLQSGNKIQVYNKGTIKGDALTMNQNAELYNYGKLDIKTLTVSGGGAASVLYNDLEGVVNTGSVALGGSGMYLYNIGTMNVTGNTSTSNNTGYWVNAGTYVTGSLSLSAHAAFFHNYCKLYVNEKMLIESSTFNLKDDSYLEAGKAHFQNGLVKLGANAVFYVKEETKVNAPGSNMQGFKGLSDSKPALVKLGGQTVRENNADKKHMLSFSGNLKYAAENMFAETTNTGNQPNIEMGVGAECVVYSQVNLSQPTEEQCAPTWSIGSGGGSGEDTPLYYTYAFEDMMQEVGDYDFNDVVLHVSTPIENKITVKLVAAGATKKLHVKFKNGSTVIDLFDGADVHTALGVPAGTITNTVELNGTVKEEIISVSADFSLLENGDFYILDGRLRDIHIPKFTPDFEPGDAPYALRVPGAWLYPRERVSVEVAYIKFVEWAQSLSESLDWYSTATAGEVFED